MSAIKTRPVERLYDEYIKRLVQVNDETVDEETHNSLLTELRGWQQGVYDSTGHRFNGDYYYMEKGIDRPMCAGVFLDWGSKE